MAIRAHKIARPNARSTRRHWQIAAAVAVTVMVVGLATTLTPGGVAFARDRALAALVPPAGRVLVFSVDVTSSDASVGAMTETTWIDASAGTWRTETRDSNGGIISARVAIGGKALWTDKSSNVLIEETVAPVPEAGFPVWLVTLRDMVASPDKRVKISEIAIDGSKFWQLENPKSYEDLAPFKAVIAVKDYRPTRIEIGGQGANGDQRAIWTVTEWKSVPSSSLKPDFFSFDQVTRLKPEGTPIQKNQ
jgi:hypothetical protein